MSDAELARRALRCLDLTELSDSCSALAVDALCDKAATPHGPVAAVCVWPQYVERARDALRDTPVRIATVVNFPSGDKDLERVIEDSEEAVGDGADEIDCVMPYHAYLRGEIAPVRELLTGVREVVGGGRTLKVIIESGALGDAATIERAARLAIEAGADFIKTSTGKGARSATPQATEAILGTIRACGLPVGLKVSGGIRTLEDVRVHLDLVDRIMGRAWVTPRTFRVGASGLYEALVAAIDGPTRPSAL